MIKFDKPLTPHAKNQFIKFLQDAVEISKQMPTTTRCFDCSHYSGGNCLKWKSPIPKENLDSGCEEWVFSELSPPF